MKKNRNIFTILALLAALLCSCGEDRTAEFDQLTQENQWIYAKMKEVYLWADEMGEVQQRDYFATPAQFLKKLLNKQDNASFLTDNSESSAAYGITYTLLRDPLNISPSKQYALIEFVDPNSAAKAAGLERGMWVSEIDGKRVTASNAKALIEGDGASLKIETIELNDESGEYYWEPLSVITLPAATSFDAAAVPVVEIMDDIASKNGYILCNEFDAKEVHAAIATVLQGGANNIIFDLRYNNSNSLAAATEVVAAFVPNDKQGAAFCYLSKTTDGAVKESVALPASSFNASDKPLYIITTQRSGGVVNAFVKAVKALRGDVKIAGQAAAETNLHTERYASPFVFDINPVTAYIFDAEGLLLTHQLPDYAIDEYNAHYPIYPLGSKQENIVYNISYVIENGTLPLMEE